MKVNHKNREREPNYIVFIPKRGDEREDVFNRECRLPASSTD